MHRLIFTFKILTKIGTYDFTARFSAGEFVSLGVRVQCGVIEGARVHRAQRLKTDANANNRQDRVQRRNGRRVEARRQPHFPFI
jgi:hypothetical protein